MRRLSTFLVAEHRAHPWMLPGIALTAAAALGSLVGGCVADTPAQRATVQCQRNAPPWKSAECIVREKRP